jgi:hypothetical protein
MRHGRRDYVPPRRPALPEPRPFPLPLGGMFSTGDASMIPTGYVLLLQNVHTAPNDRYDCRAPFEYDSLSNIGGLMTWNDTTSKALRLVALVPGATGSLNIKNVSGETWATGVSPLDAPDRVSAFTTLRGTLFYVGSDGLTPGRVDYGSSTAITTGLANILGSSIKAVTATVAGERLLLGNVGFVVSPLGSVYNIANVWGLTNAAAVTVTSGSTVLCRVAATAATGGEVRPLSAADSGLVLGTSSTPVDLVYRVMARGTSDSYRMPMTAEIYIASQWANAHVYGANDIVVPTTSNGFRFRATVAGTSAAGEPVWPTTIGATVVDNGVTWVCDGPSVIGSKEFFVPTISEEPAVSSFFCDGRLSPPYGSAQIRWRLKFGNTAVPSVTTNLPVDLAFRDGRADGDPLKSNFGQQVTVGSFKYPFYNSLGATTVATPDRFYWSEIGDGTTFRANQYWELSEYPGAITASRTIGSRVLHFKRNAFWAFQGNNNPDLPFSRERYEVGVGCIHPRAIDVFEKRVYFIGENEVYRMAADGDPEPLCGDAMREEIMNRGANWVESQSVYKAPLLTINAAQREMWIYTQKGVLYCYHIDTKRWSRHEFSGNPEVVDMLYFPGTQKMYVSFGGHGLTRMDPTSTAKDSYDNTGNTFDVTASVTFKPIELIAPRFEMCLQEVAVFHDATADQTGQTVTCAFSFDRGTTFTTSDTVTFSVSEPRISFGAMQTDVTITPKITHVGGGGKANWSISRAEMVLELMSGEWPKVQPTSSASSLTRG